MDTSSKILKEYFSFCQFQKRLDTKTLNAYTTDLKQFFLFTLTESVSDITPGMLESYISNLHQTYKPKTAKRKIASLKAFFSLP